MTPREIALLRQLRSIEISQTRIVAGVCKLELAKFTGLSRYTINRLESGQESWNIDTELIYLDGVKQVAAEKQNSK